MVLLPMVGEVGEKHFFFLLKNKREEVDRIT